MAWLTPIWSVLAKPLTTTIGPQLHHPDATLKGEFSVIELVTLNETHSSSRLHRDGTVLSSGLGPELETLYGVFLRFANQPEKYLILREGGRCAISTTISMSHRFLVSPGRIREMKILGAVLVLMLLHGMTPAPLSPALFQFVFHGCNLNSLTPEFLGEWYPELRLLLSDWIAMGPTGDLGPFRAHFSTYHDLQVRPFFFFSNYPIYF